MTRRKSSERTGRDDGFTERVLMSLVVDTMCLVETVERVKVQVFAMAQENGVALPPREEWDD